MPAFEGAGSAVRDLMSSVTWKDALFLGRPKLLRGTEANDFGYQRERKMTWSELFFDLIFVTGVRKLGDLLPRRAA